MSIIAHIVSLMSIFEKSMRGDIIHFLLPVVEMVIFDTLLVRGMMELLVGIFDSRILIILGKLDQYTVPMFIQIDACISHEKRYMYMLFYEKMIRFLLFQRIYHLWFK